MVATLLETAWKRSCSHRESGEGHLIFCGRCVECFSNICCSLSSKTKYVFAVTNVEQIHKRYVGTALSTTHWTYKYRETIITKLVFLIRFYARRDGTNWSLKWARLIQRYPSLVRTGAIQSRHYYPSVAFHLNSFKDRSETAKGNSRLWTGCQKAAFL